MKLIEDKHITINDRILYCEDWTEGNIVIEYVDDKKTTISNGFYQYDNVFFIIENGKILKIDKYFRRIE